MGRTVPCDPARFSAQILPDPTDMSGCRLQCLFESVPLHLVGWHQLVRGHCGCNVLEFVIRGLCIFGFMRLDFCILVLGGSGVILAMGHALHLIHGCTHAGLLIHGIGRGHANVLIGCYDVIFAIRNAILRRFDIKNVILRRVFNMFDVGNVILGRVLNILDVGSAI